MKTKTVASIALVILVVGVLTVLLILSFSTLTTRETGLMSTILTLLSILATWIVSFVYSESIHKNSIFEAKEAHQENLRTYALKASEKVTNLSDQLSQLSEFLEAEIGSSDFETMQELVNSREQRIVSAIQMLSMLKSVNDTSLSDWQGVIGDELEERREEKQELQEHVLELTERLERLLEKDQEKTVDSGTYNHDQLMFLRDDISKIVGDLTGRRPVPRITRKTIRRDVTLDCKKCNDAITYRQRSKKNTAKKVECRACKSKFVSRYDEDKGIFYLEDSRDIPEKIECEECHTVNDILLNSFPGSVANIDCTGCVAKYRAVRYNTGEVRLKQIGGNQTPPIELTDEVVEKVQSLLPDQPWPKHIHKSVAQKLGVSNATVQKAIRKLIRDGVFKEQIDGKLYELTPASGNII